MEDQPRPVLRIANGDRSAVVDENRRHPHTVDVDPALAPIDRDPLPAVVMQHYLGQRGGCPVVEADVYAVSVPNGHISAYGKDELPRAEPDDQRRTERLRRHRHPLLPHSKPIILESDDRCPPAMMRREPIRGRRRRPTAAASASRPAAG